MISTARPGSAGPLGAWLVLAVVVNAVAFAVTHVAPFAGHPQVAYAAAFDVAVTVPVLYYLLVVRKGAQSALTLIPLALVASLRALYIAPHLGALRPAFGALAEVVVIGFLVARVRRGLRTGDPRQDIVARVRSAGVEMLRVPALADLLATEVAVVYYAFAPRPTPHVPTGFRGFTVHRESGVGTWFVCLAFLSLLEAAVLHLVVAVAHPVAARVLTAASVYGAVWLVAMGRSFALRPILVGEHDVEIRSGLLASVRVLRSQIASVEPIAPAADARSGDWRVTPMTSPNLRLTFTAPVTGRALYGRTRTVTRLALTVDDPQAFTLALDLQEQP